MRRLAAWWFAPAPAERLAALRLVIGTYALGHVLVHLPELARVSRLGAAHFAPVGLARVLGAPLAPALVMALAAATCALLVAFVAGVAYRVTAPLAALGLVWTLGYRHAWGQVFHTDDLLALHVLALALAPAADVWALGPRRHPAAAGYGWPIKGMVALAVVTYVLAGVAKLRLSGLGWLDGEQLRNQIAIDNVRKAVLGAPTAPLAVPLLGHPAGLTALAALALGVELGAPVALLGGRSARAWAGAAWLFHVGVVLGMNIVFPYALLGLAYLPLVAAERPFVWWRERGGRPPRA